MGSAAEALAALEAAWPRWVHELADFIGIASVSGDPRHQRDVRRAARWLCARLRHLGMARARLVETGGSPLVVADWRAAPTAPTVLMYGHYDVVAPGSLEQWRSPPFVPRECEGFLYGRGASDDKGPLVCHLAALESWLSGAGRLPVSVACVFEGEEEVGSPGLRRMLERGWRPAPDGRPVDAALVSDTRMLGPGSPTLIVGLRGSLGAEVEVTGLPREVHSGAFGGAVRNPVHVLCELIGSLHDRHGRVAIPGFYADVRPPPRSGRDARAERAVSAALLSETGARAAFGEPGYSVYERTALRPALDVNGLTAGHTGPGSKGIVPARASAKLSFRLVPDQDPHRVAALFREHLVRHAPRGIGINVSFSKAASPVRIDPRRPALRAASAALNAGFGRRPTLLYSGGTIPVVELFARGVGDPVLMGFARPDDGMHGPNERVDLGALADGTRSVVHFLHLLGRTSRTPARGSPPRMAVAS